MTADLVTAAMDPDDGTCLRHPEIHLCRPGPGGEWRRLLRDCPLCRVARSPPAPVRPARGALGDPCRSLGGGGRFRRSSADRGKAAPGGPPRAPPEPPSRPSDAWDGSPSSGDDLGRGLRRLSLSGQCSIGTDRTDTTVASSTTGSVPSSASGPLQGHDRRGHHAPATPGSSSAPRDALALTPGAMTLSPASPADLGTPGRAHTPGSNHSAGSAGRGYGYGNGVCPPSHHSQSSQHSHQSQHSQHSQRSQHSQLSHRSQHSQSSRGSQSRGVRRASACGEVVCGLRHVDPSNGRPGSYTGQVDPGTGLPDGIGTLR